MDGENGAAKSIYDIIYDHAAGLCEANGTQMPYSRRVYDNWVGKNPLLVSEAEFECYGSGETVWSECLAENVAVPEGGVPREVIDNVMYRCMARFKRDHVDGIYARVIRDMGEYSPRAVVNALITILHHSAEAKETGWVAEKDGRYRPRLRDRLAIVHYLLYQYIGWFYYAVLKIKIIEPLWDSLSNDTKNRIRGLFGREKK